MREAERKEKEGGFVDKNKASGSKFLMDSLGVGTRGYFLVLSREWMRKWRDCVNRRWAAKTASGLDYTPSGLASESRREEV